MGAVWQRQREGDGSIAFNVSWKSNPGRVLLSETYLLTDLNFGAASAGRTLHFCRVWLLERGNQCLLNSLSECLLDKAIDSVLAENITSCKNGQTCFHSLLNRPQ